jgi:hypothetical protein
MFFVSVDSKELSFSVSSLFSTLTSKSTSVDSKRLIEAGKWNSENGKFPIRREVAAIREEHRAGSRQGEVKRGKPRTCREGGREAVRGCEVASTRQDSTRV